MAIYQAASPSRKPVHQSMQPIGRAYLRTRSEIVNEQYDKTIVMQYVWPEFSQHVMKKFNWSTAVLDSINWKAFQHEARKLDINRRTNLLKFIYEWLPIGKNLRRNDPIAATSCPSCDVEIETPHHLFCCPKPERQQITAECVKRIQDICSQSTTRQDPPAAIAFSLKYWTSNPTRQPPHAQVVSADLRAALQAQAAIGWGNFFKGFIAKDLQRLVNATREQPLNQFEQIRWTCEVIQPLWTGEHDHWKQRNKDRHGHSPEEEANIKRERLLQRARDLYELKTQLDPSHQSKIFPPWQRIEAKKTNNLEHWINTTKQTVDYLLDTNKLADDDPPRAHDQPSPHVPTPPARPSSPRLPTPSGRGTIAI
jgi:hypothetical protein